MNLVLFSGMPCSGKTTAINFLKEKFPVISMGDEVRKEMKEKNIREDIRCYSKKIREKDKSYVAKLCLKQLNFIDKKSKICIIDGIRNYEEVEEFKKYYNSFLISIHASPKARFERYIARKRKDDILDFDGFLKRDISELSLGIGNVIALSDFIIINEDNDIEKFKKEVDKILNKILENY